MTSCGRRGVEHGERWIRCVDLLDGENACVLLHGRFLPLSEGLVG